MMEHLDPERLSEYSRELIKFALGNQGHSAFCKDLNSQYFNCNNQFLVDCSMDSKTNVIGKSDHDLLWTKEESALYRLSDQEIFSKQACKLKFLELQTDLTGKQKWVETSKYPLFGIDGDIVGVLGTYHQVF